MSQELWSRVDSYIVEHIVGHDPVLEGVLEAAKAAGLPDASVSPSQGKLLYLLARLQGARNVLEIGTLAGYSTIWLARAMPRYGRLVTLEIDEKHAAVARESIERAGYSDVVDILAGPALAQLEEMARGRKVPYEMVFIDADRENMPAYFEYALKFSKPGSLIVVNDVVREGKLADAESTDEAVLAARKLHDILARERRVSATTVQTVGSKGYDGLTIVLVHE